MKKIYAFLFITMSLTGFSQNLVSNPTFDDGLTGWSAGPTTSYNLPSIIVADGSNGSNSAQYIATATTGFYQEIPVTEGSQLEISFWYLATGDGTDARIWSNYKDAANAVVYQDATTSNDPLRTNNSYLPTSSAWTQKVISVVVPPTATKLVLAFRTYSGGTVSFDQISVVQTVLGLKQNTISGLSIFPNPVISGTLNIISNSNEAKNVAIYDILGKQVLSNKTVNGIVNVSSLKSGVYILKIDEKGKSDTKKLIIQ